MSEFDMNSPEAPLLRLYELISGPKDEERPWGEISSLFLPGTRIRMEVEGADGSARSGDWSLKDFAREASASYRVNGFWEREVARRSERFGNICHVFSTYESRIGNPGSDPVGRGINSVQMLRRDGRWRIASIVFHKEQPREKIPQKYLVSET